MKLTNPIRSIQCFFWLAILSLFLTACVEIGSEETGVEANQEPDSDAVEVEDTEQLDEEKVEVEEDPGLPIQEREIKEFFIDLDSSDHFDATRHKLIEYEQTYFLSHALTADLLELDIRYDADNFFAEIFQGESEYEHQAVNNDQTSSELAVNEYWLYIEDDYWRPEEDSIESLFIEYEGELYIPERIIELAGTSVRYDRQTNLLELGESSVETEIGALDYNERGSTDIVQNQAVTFEGENLGSGFEIDAGFTVTDVHRPGVFTLITNSEYAIANLTFSVDEIGYNATEHDIEITTGRGTQEQNQVFTLVEGETLEIELDIAATDSITFTSNGNVIFYLTGYVK